MTPLSLHPAPQIADLVAAGKVRLEVALNLPLAQAAEVGVPHRKAFNAYLRTGDDDGLRGLVLEGKALNASVAADGGYLVDP